MRMPTTLIGIIVIAAAGCSTKTDGPQASLVEPPKQQEERPALSADSKEIAKAVELLKACPGPFCRSEHQFVPLVRVVNYLHSLGKQNAVLAVKEFINRSGDAIGDTMCLHLVVPLLFSTTRYDGASFEGHYGHYARFSIELQNDIPFNIDPSDGGEGGFGSNDFLVEWAIKSGKLRHRPLRPADNPLDAADQLLSNITDRDVHNRLLRSVRIQAWRAIAPLLDPLIENPDRDGPSVTKRGDWWEQVKADVASKHIRWDEKKQEYTSAP